MKRAMETFRHDEMKSDKVAFCDNNEITDLDTGVWRKTDKLLNGIHDNWLKLSGLNKLPRFCCDSTKVTKLPMIHPTEKSSVTEVRVKNGEKIVQNVLEQSATTETNTENIDAR